MTPVWLDGALLDAAAARIDPADRGFLLGDGLFETIRVLDGRPDRLAAHLARLRAGAAVLEIPLPYGDDALASALAGLAGAARIGSGSLRLTLTRGPGPRGLLPPGTPRPTVLATAAPAGPSLPPARVVVATVTRRNERSPLSRLKTLNYLDGVMARQEAARRGADDALMLNGAGRLAEATAANLFAVIDGRPVTPPVEEGALPGIARAEAIARLGAVERPVALSDLARATEIVLTSSLSIRPVVAVDGRPVGDGGPGSMAAALAT
ncbi:aminotransferase class IV [Arenibaculum pallidiluteum]|uniref:aminotransferase class IV n=1 Tax=Arenibaculum pallidiluteum TaxID=2812559 RepID=UPI002E27E453|nr:aminotransferase class IV [Arenibaculum pallidiluteum]